MESEKVKTIKKGLECCSTLMDNNATSEEQDNSCNECPYRQNDRCSWNLDKDALTLINKLESKNERLTEEKDLYKKQFNKLEPRFFDLREENKQLKDRISELEKGNEALSFAVKQGFNDCQAKTIKQFAEKLKEKMSVREYMGVKYKQGVFSENDIDETLKKFLGEEK